jgi:hypothetical protein
MPRFLDIFYLVVFISLAIGFTNGLFTMATGTTSSYMEQPNISGSLYTLSDARTTMNGSQPSSFDSFTAGIGALGMALGFVATMLNIFTLYGTLMNVFHVPLLVTTFISGGIGLVYMLFIIQFLTARYFKLFGD